MQADRTVRAVGAAGGALLAFVGLLTTYNLLARPEQRIGGALLEPLFFLGPMILTAGLVLLVLVIPSRELTGRTPPVGGRLLHIGFGLIVLPGILLVGTSLTGDERLGLWGTLALALLGFPGVALIIVGTALRLLRRKSG